MKVVGTIVNFKVLKKETCVDSQLIVVPNNTIQQAQRFLGWQIHDRVNKGNSVSKVIVNCDALFTLLTKFMLLLTGLTTMAVTNTNEQLHTFKV